MAQSYTINMGHKLRNLNSHAPCLSASVLNDRVKREESALMGDKND